MPVFLVVIGVAAAYFLIPKKAANVAVIQTTPGNGGVGITTGFAEPSVTQGTSLQSSASQTNAPSPASSGVPVYSSESQEFTPYHSQDAPGVNPLPTFYNTGVSLAPGNRLPQFTHSDHAAIVNGCGCGGGGRVSDCAVEKKRSSDAGCLAPTSKTQIDNMPKGVIAKWAANLQSSPASSLFITGQQEHFDAAATHPKAEGHDLTPASPFLQPIGHTATNIYGY